MNYTIFNDELNLIKNERLKESCIELLKILPEYFYNVEASSSGKYHPAFALGEGGLVRHTKVAVKIADEIIKTESVGNVFTQDEKDMILISLMLHDGLKKGIVEEKYTRFDHPILMADYLMDCEESLGLEVEEIEFLGDVIKTHMGVWTTDYNGNEILEKPKTKYQNFVHMCDYLASRKCILVPFDEENKISVE